MHHQATIAVDYDTNVCVADRVPTELQRVEGKDSTAGLAPLSAAKKIALLAETVRSTAERLSRWQLASAVTTRMLPTYSFVMMTTTTMMTMMMMTMTMTMTMWAQVVALTVAVVGTAAAESSRPGVGKLSAGEGRSLASLVQRVGNL